MNDVRNAASTAAALSGVPLIGPVGPPYVQVMTYNLKTASGRAPHSWWKRRPYVSGVVRDERPTVLCTQEGQFYQLRELREDLDGYDWLHLGSGGGSRSGSTAILWDASRLVPVAYDHLWLSRHPDRIGSRAWGALVRMVTWIRFEDKATGKDFHVANVHLDHRSEKARRKGAAMLVDVVNGFHGPAVLAGDFNCGPDSKARAVIAKGGMADAWDETELRLTPDWSTFNRWKAQPVEGGRRIDWIMVKSGPRGQELAVHQAGVNTRTGADLVPSDHWPVQAVFTIGRR